MAINFPSATSVGETYTDPVSGSSFVCVAVGPPAQWVGSGSSTSLDNTYLRKDASNDPVTGQLGITPATDTTGLVVTQPSGNTAAAMRITNEGSGDSLVIEDSANPDSTSIVADSSGRLLVGTSSSVTNLLQGGIQLAGNAEESYLTLTRYTALNDGPAGIVIGRSKSETKGVNTVVVNGDALGAISFSGTDGTNFVHGASIAAYVDAAVTNNGNEMPSSLVFSTTADGASNPTERMRIDSSGRLLAGTSSTSSISNTVFQGSGGSSDVAVIRLATNSATPADGDALSQIIFAESSSNHQACAVITAARDGGTWSSITSRPTSLVFSTAADGAGNPTERMRIGSNGYVKVATNNDPGNYAELSPVGIVITNTTSSTLRSHHIFRNPNGEVGKIATNGTTTGYFTSSDYRLKENVTAVTDGITRLKQLKPNRFNFIADPDTVVDGFLAHEVQDIVPEAITGEKDEVDDEGNPVYQGIDQSKLVPLLTAALQEAVGEIESLKSRVAALEAA